MPEFSEGVPCWVDATVRDLEAARRFYGELFGWTFEQGADASEVRAYSDGRRVAGLAARATDERPPNWNVYFATEDVDAATGRVKEAGGEVLIAPTAVGDTGRVAVALSPDGAAFGLWQLAGEAGFEKHTDVNSYCWTAVYTRDAEASGAFFPKVFPFRQVATDPILTWAVGETPVASLFPLGDDAPAEMPAHAAVCFAVADCDAAVKQAAELGGRVLFGPETTPGGRFASVADPDGAVFSVVTIAS